MTSTPDPDPARDSIQVVSGDGGQAEPAPVPELDDSKAASLAALLKRARSAPDQWHLLPDSGLVLRAKPIDSTCHTFCFEMRKIGSDAPNEIRSYHYDHMLRVLSYRTNDAIKHSDVQPRVNFCSVQG